MVLVATNINEAGLYLANSPCRVRSIQTKPTDSVLLVVTNINEAGLNLDSSPHRVGGVQTKPTDSVLLDGDQHQ